MKNIFKSIARSFTPGILFNVLNAYRLKQRARKKGVSIDILLSFKKVADEADYVRQFSKAVKKVRIKKEFYINPFDDTLIRQIPCGSQQIVSITPDFDRVLGFTLLEYRRKIDSLTDKHHKQSLLKLLESIEILANRITNALDDRDERESRLKCYYKRMLNSSPQNFDEALQKVLFFDALFWQMNHMHIGLGRLDVILMPYYLKDFENNIITKDKAKELLVHFLRSLSRDTKAKSVSLIGDTGQYILLGGIGRDGNNVDNELTELFLEVFAEYDRPDPKLILRVNDGTSHGIWKQSVECLATGIGSPLIMNETVVMDSMTQFGYRKEDLYQLGTSACWEPLIIGKSFDQNNPLPNIISLKPLNELIKSDTSYSTFEAFLTEYKRLLCEHIKKSVKDITFDVSPLFTLFTDDCLEKELDFTRGGARYNYHGIQIVSFPNTINALLNIKKFVFEDGIISLSDCKNVIMNNFSGRDDILALLQVCSLKFGSTKDEVVTLTNELIDTVGQVSQAITINGNKVKVGFSSSQYIARSQNFEASMDGRKNGEPFGVHISPVSSDIDIVEILDFASKLNYDGNKINGNVVDFIIPEAYLSHQDKFVDLLKTSCKKGIFQIQLNVLNRDMLIDAKAHPEKYPHLIVRVWGFSAYFNDIPEAYKDNLIHRASLYCA